jgi:hypothetical protein
MSKRQDLRQLLVAATLSFAAAACSHNNNSPSAQINAGFAPFSSTRTQTVGLVANTKRSLGPADINTLAVAYTALEEKANAYAGFMMEAVRTSSFDPGKNAEYSADFARAIASFDATVATFAKRQPSVANAWVPTFAQSLQARWNQYSGAIAQMTPQTKADFMAQLKRATVWPNYEDIATEPLVGSR